VPRLGLTRPRRGDRGVSPLSPRISPVQCALASPGRLSQAARDHPCEHGRRRVKPNQFLAPTDCRRRRQAVRYRAGDGAMSPPPPCGIAGYGGICRGSVRDPGRTVLFIGGDPGRVACWPGWPTQAQPDPGPADARPNIPRLQDAQSPGRRQAKTPLGHVCAPSSRRLRRAACDRQHPCDDAERQTFGGLSVAPDGQFFVLMARP
jgi:hypothetical protein